MKIGLVGYLGSGKSTLFEWLTDVRPDPSLAHHSQSAMALIQAERIAALQKIYQPKKITHASLEIVDTPGLDRRHEGSASRLAQIREAGCLVIVVGAYQSELEPLEDLASFEEDLLLADLEIVTRRIERLQESIKKPRPDREEQQAELLALEPIAEALGEGKKLQFVQLTDEQLRATRGFQLLTQKPRLVVLNVSDDCTDVQQIAAAIPEDVPWLMLPLGLELELVQLEPGDRDEFIREMSIEVADRNSVLRAILNASGQLLFFTAGEKEVRSWLIPRGGTALEAAGNIHTDMARGFIRAETMKSEDLIRVGSERQMKADNLVRQEPKDYVVEEGDILLMKFNV